jgi:predicted alpha/beta-hydrolase family hydrolase
MSEEKLTITVGEKTVSAIRTSPEGDARFTFVYAPGAGSTINDPFGDYLSPRLRAAGCSLVRFQFPYMEAGKRGPDRAPLLEKTWRAVIDTVRPSSGKLVVGGRSMGGRIASRVVAQGTKVDGLALLAYPLNPPRTPATPRNGHLPDIAVPTLFCSGTRDNFAAPGSLAVVVDDMPNAALHELDGADHGFAVLKSSGRTREDVWQEVADVILNWVEGILS